jgi:8-oxo-dGTP pyrophosphatase MutT (NUDIX family)
MVFPTQRLPSSWLALGWYTVSNVAMSREESRRRDRATAVVVRDCRVLLVREAGVPYFSLPGGGIHKAESAAVAAAREIWEELGLVAVEVERVGECDHAGSLNDHQVCLVQTDGNPVLRGHELEAFYWWDMKESIPLHPHVKAILAKVGRLGKPDRH